MLHLRILRDPYIAVYRSCLSRWFRPDTIFDFKNRKDPCSEVRKKKKQTSFKPPNLKRQLHCVPVKRGIEVKTWGRADLHDRVMQD